jgi:ribosomal protein L37AE/L43A
MKAIVKTIWLAPGQDVKFCPYCHSTNVRPTTQVGGVWGCDDCENVFQVRRYRPPHPKIRAMSYQEVALLRQKLLEKGGF